MADTQNIVTLQNIDDEDFMFEYNRSEGNPPYLIKAGEVARYPKFLAKHALKHLIDKIMNKNEEITGNQARRDELASQILIGEEVLSQVREPTETEKLQSQVQELNQPSNLDKILSKKKAEKDHKVEKKRRKDEGEPEVEEKFEGLPDAPELPEVPKAVVNPKTVPFKPTRKELFNYAEKEMNMVLSEKTVKKFNKMKVDDLITELNYPIK